MTDCQPSPSMPLRTCLLASAVVLLGAINWERPRPPVQPDQSYPDYPHRDLTTCYEVDTSWPRRPSHVSWGPITGVAVDHDDRVWLATSGSPRVQVYDRRGEYQFGWGDESLEEPHQLRIAPDGSVWVVDAALHVVRQFTPDGKLLLTLGTSGEPGTGPAHFNTPTDVAIADSGDVFISDGYRNSRVVHFSPAAKFVRDWGQLGTSHNQLSLPHSIVWLSGRIYVAERANGRVQVFDEEGQFLEAWTGLAVPWGLAVTGRGQIWVCGSSPTAWRDDDKVLGTPPRDQLLIRFDQYGRAQQQWYVPCAANRPAEPGELKWVHCIAEDSQGNLYCGDVRANRLLKFVARQPIQ